MVEELIRIKGYDQINMIEPQKVRKKETLNKKQKLFHFLQRAVASKGYLEAITGLSLIVKLINYLLKKIKKLR